MRHPSIIIFMGSYVIRQQSEFPLSSSNNSLMSIMESTSSLISNSSFDSSSNKMINNDNTNACIIMELMSGGSMADLFAKERVIANCVTRYNINNFFVLSFFYSLSFFIIICN